MTYFRLSKAGLKMYYENFLNNITIQVQVCLSSIWFEIHGYNQECNKQSIIQSTRNDAPFSVLSP